MFDVDCAINNNKLILELPEQKESPSCVENHSILFSNLMESPTPPMNLSHYSNGLDSISFPAWNDTTSWAILINIAQDVASFQAEKIISNLSH